MAQGAILHNIIKAETTMDTPPNIYTESVYMPPGSSPQGNSSQSKPIEANYTLLRTLGIPQRRFINLTRDSMNNFVFVTAASDDHVEESRDLIASIQEHSPGKEVLLAYHQKIGERYETDNILTCNYLV